MNATKPSVFTCPFCHKQKRESRAVLGEMIHGGVLEIIQEKHPEWSSEDRMCSACLDRFRGEYVQGVLEKERVEITSLEREVVQSLREHELVTQDINAEFERRLSLGERIADRVAEFGGSWPFILVFGLVLVLWIGVNSLRGLARPFDPYPYILLNLLLSCLAAIQAPVIMMSQNRQESKDRLRAEHDYRVNLKAELEIRHLHTKVDELLTRQWQRLLEIQRIQTDLLEGLSRKRSGDHG